jgi:hypothetical protein
VTAGGERLPTKRDDVLIADFDTELVVLVPGERRAHRLDAGLSLVLSACDGETAREALVREVANGTGDDLDATGRWLDNAVHTLA